eukprot:Skav233022  [mRNA]  locus=scaffold909:429854:433057:+ [translate_table: standard]
MILAHSQNNDADDLGSDALKTLGLESSQLAATFSDEELKKAYRQAVRRSHPDAPGGAVGGQSDGSGGGWVARNPGTGADKESEGSPRHGWHPDMGGLPSSAKKLQKVKENSCPAEGLEVLDEGLTLDAYDYLISAPDIKVWDEGRRNYGANAGPNGVPNANMGSSKPKPNAMRREAWWCLKVAAMCNI